MAVVLRSAAPPRALRAPRREPATVVADGEGAPPPPLRRLAFGTVACAPLSELAIRASTPTAATSRQFSRQASRQDSERHQQRKRFWPEVEWQKGLRTPLGGFGLEKSGRRAFALGDWGSTNAFAAGAYATLVLAPVRVRLPRRGGGDGGGSGVGADGGGDGPLRALVCVQVALPIIFIL
ncbi:hypothetical protein T492DRAFT_837169 [Pavlovales sp. CCMP2436]|nr:hypothetical protein T492DRAFT_837169 [Pavlovales sp. CCMP2436]